MKKFAVWRKFDGLHEGHITFLRHAKELGDELYIIIISDNAVKENTGKFPEKKAGERERDLAKLDFIKDVYLSASFKKGLDFILKLKPDIFAFGHDQKTKWEKELQDYLSSKGLFPQYIYLKAYNNGLHNRDLKWTI